jgi:putative flippase GtrA
MGAVQINSTRKIQQCLIYRFHKVEQMLIKTTSRIIKSFYLRYLIVGFYNTGIGYLIFFLVNFFLVDITHYLVILVLSFFLSLGHAFMAQRYIVFKSKSPWLKEYVRFFTVNLLGLTVNALLLVIFVNVGLSVLISQAISMLMVTGLSFFSHKNFSFNSKYG